MAAPVPATAHRPDEDALIAVDSPGIGIRIEEPADTEEMSVDGHSVDGSHAWCGRVLKSPLQLQVEGGSSPVNWKSLPLRHRSPDLGSASLSSPSLSPSPSPSASSPGSYDSGYGFGLFTPPDDDRRELEDSTRDYVQQQDFQDQLTRRGELLPLLQESPDLLSFHDSPLEQQILRLTFSDEEVIYLSNSVVDPNSPSSDSLFPNSSSPSIPLSGSPTLYPLAFHSPEASENGRSGTVLTTEFPPLGRKPLERSPSLPPSPGSLLLKPELAPNSTSNPSMDDKRVFDRPLSAHRHNSMSASSTQGPHGVHGLVTSHYHSPENRPQSPSFARRSLARHARIRSRSASPYEASSELHAHPRRSSSRSIPDLHTHPTETPSFLTQAHRTSSGSSVISRSPRAAGSSYRLRAASFDSPAGKTAPPTSHVRASYNPDDGSSEDVEMGSTHYLSPVGAGATRERSISFSSSSTSPSNPPSPSRRSPTHNHSSGQKVRGSRSFHGRSSMAIDPRDDEEGPSTDEGDSGSELDYDYPGSKPSSYPRHFPTSRASSSYPSHHLRSQSVSPSRSDAPVDSRYAYRITSVAPSQVSPSPVPSSSSRKNRRLSHSPVRHPEAVPPKSEDFDEELYHKRASPMPFPSPSHDRRHYRDHDSEEEGSVFDDDEEDDDYRDSPGPYRGGRSPVKQRAALPRRGSNAHLATKPIYGSPLKGSILPTDPFSDAEPSPAAKPRLPSTRGRPRSGSGALPYPSPRASVGASSAAGSDISSPTHYRNVSPNQYRNVGSKNIDMASEKRRKGDKRFQCCYKDCKKMFTTNQNRQIHQWKHTGEKPYRCKCGYGSASRSDLRRHLSRKKTVNPLCDEIPVDKKYLSSLVTDLAEAEDDE